MLEGMSQFKQRLLVGSSVLSILLLVIWFSHYPYFRPVYSLVIAATVSASLWEFYRMCRFKGYRSCDMLGIIGGALYIFAVFLSTQAYQVRWLPELFLFGVFLTGFLYYSLKGSEPIQQLSVTYFGLIYIALTLGTLIYITYDFDYAGQDGRWWLLYLLAVTKCTDMGGYFIGKGWGRHFMSPYLSPKKTWEGAVGGLIAGLLISLVFYYVVNAFETPPITLSLFSALFLGLFLSLVGQFGDLAESLLKRDAGIKDSNQLPGLGGMLDMADSLFFTAPSLYLFLRIIFI